MILQGRCLVAVSCPHKAFFFLGFYVPSVFLRFMFRSYICYKNLHLVLNFATCSFRFLVIFALVLSWSSVCFKDTVIARTFIFCHMFFRITCDICACFTIVTRTFVTWTMFTFVFCFKVTFLTKTFMAWIKTYKMYQFPHIFPPNIRRHHIQEYHQDYYL